MTQYEMTENLSVKCDVTLEEARDALEAGNWNVLTATHLLDQEKFRRMQELSEIASDGEDAAVQFAPSSETADNVVSIEGLMKQPAEQAGRKEHVKAGKHRHSQGFKNLGEHIRRLIAWGNRNRFEVRKDGAVVLELPVTVLAALMLFAFWVCLPLLIIGLFSGCRYSFNGREIGKSLRENAAGA